MILVTVGTQMPFDRLIGYVDEWVSNSNDKCNVFAQIGASAYQTKEITLLKSVEPDKFETYLTDCDLIISHAGIGSILTALRVKKPIIIFPRMATLGEHRNDHQLATAKSFSNVEGVSVATTKDELFKLLASSDTLRSGTLNDSVEYKKLLYNIENLISK
jgi:UDP-N-acetylglucosamine transferase subunit ALG13